MTATLPDRWEQGSDFHWPLFESAEAKTEVEVETAPWGEKGELFGSGRCASRALLLFGAATRGWRRFLVPSYFCQEVVASFATTGIAVVAYPDGPTDPVAGFTRLEPEPGDVVFVVNHFGLRSRPSLDNLMREGVEVIEDHSHDPWSAWAHQSRAQWCIASVRKVLPVPDGGILWSPTGETLPPRVPTTAEHRRASLEKFTAMMLKQLYLQGHPVEKTTFRNLALSGDHSIGFKEMSGPAEWTAELLRSFPAMAWRDQRQRNHRALSRALDGVTWLDVLQPDQAGGACPFSAILVFDTAERRDHVRRKLIEANIYPSILWPLDRPAIEGISHEYVDLSHRLLSVHCDMRWSSHEMEYVASRVHEFGEGYREKG